MKFYFLVLSFICYPLYAANSNEEALKAMNFLAEKEAPNTIVRVISSESIDSINRNTRTADFPTQVVRVSAKINNVAVNCADVNEKIDKVFINRITRDKFSYNTYVSCTYDPDTKYAVEYTLESYFDPLTDEAIDYLKTYLAEFNGSDLLGAMLTFEPAKALIVSINLSAGVVKDVNRTPFIEYREDRSNVYFSSNYQMQNTLIAELKEQFFSDSPDKILPFLNKWFFKESGSLYKRILFDANYVMFKPEQIFLMENGDALFVSRLKYNFAHNCKRYEHRHCLRHDEL